MNEAHQLGRALSAALTPGPSRATLLHQRAVVIAAMQAKSPRRSFSDAARPALAFAVLATLGLALWLYRPPAELSASYMGQELAERTRIVGTAPSGDSLEFSDGSRLVLSQRTEIALSKLSRERAQVQLNRGSVSARVQKGTGRSWAIDAGPYSIRVVGTEFSVEWLSEQKELSVNVTEGQVLVVGGDLPAAGVRLSAGGRLVRRGRDAAPAPQASDETPPQAVLPPPSAAGPLLTPPPSTVEPSWRALAQVGNYADALRSAERSGLEQLQQTLPEKDLLLLANTARYAGSTPRARQALLTLRSRFASGQSAPVAAFLLAGLAEDHDKNPGEAARWLRTFLRESPQGELSAGARARLLAILVRQGKRAEAASVAAEYLRFHPQGPYASKARDVLGDAAPH